MPNVIETAPPTAALPRRFPRRLARGRAGAAARSATRPAAVAATPWFVVIAAVCVGLPALIAALTGNLAIPHNDAWAMSRITQTFATTGQIRLLNWNDMNLIGQVVMLGPFGSSLVVQQLAVAALSVACLFGVFRLLAVTLSTRDALFGTALLGVWPGWAALSTSFETDVPTFAATFAALLLGQRAIKRDRAGWLAASLVVSLWAVSIREQAIVAPIAILGYAWGTRRSQRRLTARTLGLAGCSGATALCVFELWRWGLPLGQNPAPSVGALRFLSGLVTYGSRTYFTLALLLAPAVLVGAGRRRWVRRDGFALGLGLIVVALGLIGGGAVGHYFEPAGEYAQVLPGTRVVIPAALWDALVGLGCVSGALLIGVARGRWRSVDPLLGLFTILAFVEIVAVGAAGHGVFDRYLPALLPGLVALLLARPGSRLARRRRGLRGATVPTARPAAGLALAAIGVSSVLLAANGFAFDAARWRAAQRVAQAGVPASRVAAGLEWSGWHAPHGMIYGDERAGLPGGWESAFSRAPACVVVSPSPLRTAATAGEASWTPAGASDYATFLVAGRSRLYLYRTHAAGCPV